MEVHGLMPQGILLLTPLLNKGRYGNTHRQNPLKHFAVYFLLSLVGAYGMAFAMGGMTSNLTGIGGYSRSGTSNYIQ